MTDSIAAAIIIAGSILFASYFVVAAIERRPKANFHGLEEAIRDLAKSFPSLHVSHNDLIEAAYDIAGKKRPPDKLTMWAKSLQDQASRGGGSYHDPD